MPVYEFFCRKCQQPFTEVMSIKEHDPLAISGKREEEKREEGERYFTYERSHGSFSRSFTVPEGVGRSLLQWATGAARLHGWRRAHTERLLLEPQKR